MGIHIVACKAEPIAGRPVPDVVIEIIDPLTEQIPKHLSLAAVEEFYDNQANLIVNALFDSLPQGTADRLWIHAMRRKLSLYQGTTTG